MNNQEENFQELSLGEILQVLIDKKLPIIAGTLLIGLITYGITHMIPETFKANTSLIIQGPEIPITGEATPLRVEMLEALTLSTDIKMKVYLTLQENKSINPELSFRAFQKNLETSVVREKGLDPKLLPMIELIAYADSAEQAKSFANVWAETVLDRTRNIYTSGIEELSDFIGTVSNSAQVSLRRDEELFTSKTLSANLDVEKSRLSQREGTIKSLNKEIFSLSSELESNIAQLNSLVQTVNQQMLDGEWLGDVATRLVRNGSILNFDSLTSDTSKLVSLVQDLTKREIDLFEFEKKSQLNSMERRLLIIQGVLDITVEEIQSLKQSIALAKREHEILTKAITNIPEKIKLNKAITDDALWQAELQGDSSKALDGKLLVTEEINPLYQETKSKILDALLTISISEEKIIVLKNKETELEKEEEQLGSSNFLIAQEIAMLKEGVERDKALVQINRQSFTKNKILVEDLSSRNKDIAMSLNVKRKSLVPLIIQTKSLKRKVADDERDLTLLKREIDKVHNVFNSMSEKSEEVTLLGLSANQASRSGATILYRAELNPGKVAPAKARITLIAMMIATFVLSLFFLIRKMLRDA